MRSLFLQNCCLEESKHSYTHTFDILPSKMAENNANFSRKFPQRAKAFAPLSGLYSTSFPGCRLAWGWGEGRGQKRRSNYVSRAQFISRLRRKSLYSDFYGGFLYLDYFPTRKCLIIPPDFIKQLRGKGVGWRYFICVSKSEWQKEAAEAYGGWFPSKFNSLLSVWIVNFSSRSLIVKYNLFVFLRLMCV